MEQFESNIYTLIWGKMVGVKKYGFSDVKFSEVQSIAIWKKQVVEVQCSEV